MREFVALVGLRRFYEVFDIVDVAFVYVRFKHAVHRMRLMGMHTVILSERTRSWALDDEIRLRSLDAF